MYEEFNRRIHNVIKDKIFLSKISGMPATVVEKLPEEIVEGEVLFDGMMLYDSGVRGEEFPIFLRTLAYMYPERYVPMWEKYHGEHPEVEYSREECLAWAEKQQEMFRQNANVKDHLPG